MLKPIAPDKWRHFFAGIFMGFVLQGLLCWLLPNDLLSATSVALLLVIAISYGFELFSKITGKGRYDFMDAVASAVGGILGMGSMVIVVLLLQQKIV